MKRLIALVMLMLLLPALACAQGLDAGLEQALGQVDLAPLETAAREDNLRVYLLRLAKGEMIWDARQVLDTLLRRLYGEARSSFSRMMGLLAPALLARRGRVAGRQAKGRNQDRRERVLPGAGRYDCCRYAALYARSRADGIPDGRDDAGAVSDSADAACSRWRQPWRGSAGACGQRGQRAW